jgi:3-hydroxyisobutyrate dehydrogenase-like beta-hydroxyacid dehydrogenase
MAGHLAMAGHAVTVYNRTPAKAQAFVAEFAAQGVQLAATPREAAAQADIVFCCVGNDDDLRAVLGCPQADGSRADDGAFAGMAPGSVLVDHTTASAEVARELSELAQARGLAFLDAPVSGGQAGAQNGQLTVMCGGAPEVFESVQPVAQAFSRAFTRIGGRSTRFALAACCRACQRRLPLGRTPGSTWTWCST